MNYQPPVFVGRLRLDDVIKIPEGFRGDYVLLDSFGKTLLRRASQCCRTSLLEVTPEGEGLRVRFEIHRDLSSDS